MYKSKEIRWFFENINQEIIDWFDEKAKMNFENTAQRTDYYLPILQDDISVKTREGNIEIKQRISQPREGSIAKNANGYFEDWVKLSSTFNNPKEFLNDINKIKGMDWVEIKKIRMGYKLGFDANNKLTEFSLKKKLDFGCQIEYTKIEVKDKAWYSFALEWFGNDELMLPKDYFQTLFNNNEFIYENSMGYAEFIKLYIRKYL